MAAPYDLPPWLTGEQDKGFLQGAQLGISAARTGTEIAQTRQQMQESADLQPFRVAAADIGNRLQRQQVDLGAAMFPLKIQQAELANQMAGLQVTSQGYSNTLKSIEVNQVQDDLPKWMDFQADPTAEKAIRFTSPVFQRQAGTVLDFKSKTNVEQAAALSRNAFSTSLKELAEMAPDRVPYVTSLLKDGMPTGEAFDQLGTEIIKARLSKQALDEQNKLGLFKGQQDIMEKRQLDLVKERNAGILKVAEERASKVDVNKSGLTRDIFNARKQALMKEASMTGDYSRLNQFLDDAEAGKLGTDSETKPGSHSLEKLVTDATDEYQQAFVAGDAKKTAAAKEKLTRAKTLELRSKGKVFNPDDVASWDNLQDGELVVFPANLTSTKAEERVDSVRKFSRKAAEAMLVERAKSLETEIRKDEASRKAKKESDARWLNFRPSGPF